MNNFFCDTHAHVYKEYYDDIDLVLKNAKDVNVSLIVNSAVDKNSAVEVLDLCSKYDCFYATLGIHPEYSKIYLTSDLEYIEENLLCNKVIAVGEIGLDYHYDDYDKDSQIQLFRKQLDLAVKYNLPVIIHSRDAVMDTINILSEYNVKGVIHSFSGSYEVAMQYIKMGFLLGLNGVVTFKNCNMKDYLANIDLSNIVLETDSPYLTPVPYRGKRNEPNNIVNIADFLTKIYGKSSLEIAQITTNNVKRIFDI